MSTVTGFRSLALGCAALALFVIMLGAYVRLSDAGLGCPDWPGCYGRLLAPTAEPDVAAATSAYPERPVEVGKAWKEMIHRYVAGLLGFGILLLAGMAWFARGLPAGLRLASTGLLALVVFQGYLGMLTVTWLLKPLVVVAHLLGGISVLALLWWLVLRTGRPGHPVEPPPALPASWPALGLVVVLLQVALGGWTSTNYAALACTDFPTCHGRWWPGMDWAAGFTLWHGLGIDYEFGILDSPARTAIHFGHRLGAVLVSVVVAGVALRALATTRPELRWSGVILLAALGVQVALGVANVKLGLPLYNAVAHTGGAAVLVLAMVRLLHQCMPVRRAEPVFAGAPARA